MQCLFPFRFINMQINANHFYLGRFCAIFLPMRAAERQIEIQNAIRSQEFIDAAALASKL